MIGYDGPTIFRLMPGERLARLAYLGELYSNLTLASTTSSSYKQI
jgi:hypothetical protein